MKLESLEKNLLLEVSAACRLPPEEILTKALIHYVKCHLGAKNDRVAGIVCSYEISKMTGKKEFAF